MELSLNILNKYHEEGLLYKQVHPTLPLTIWNYSEKVQYEGLWDEVTMSCRPEKGDYVYVQEKMDGSLGILFYYEYELSEEKRYNLWFNNNYETGMERFFDPNNLPDYDNSYYEPTPKTKGEWVMATRGSFTSEQAVMGLEIVKEKYFLDSWMKEYAYLLEIIYPENRIVGIPLMIPNYIGVPLL